MGHSSLPIDRFIELLQGAGIEAVADVRRYPGSRAHPHFNPGPLEGSLAQAEIELHHFPELGGRRAPRTDSANSVWRNAAFRGYADYMETEPFRAGLRRLLELGQSCPVAIMCAEGVWWRCHRSLIADALKVQGVEVLHLMGGGRQVEHPYTSAARIEDGMLSYRPPADD